MYALTLWPEWLPTITHMGKRVENRSWPPPAHLVGCQFVLHAGKQIGGGSRQRGISDLLDVARLAGWEVGYEHRWSRFDFRRAGADTDWASARIHLGAAVATARLAGAVQNSNSPWAMEGQWHWLLEDVQILPEPIPARGWQGLWRWSP